MGLGIRGTGVRLMKTKYKTAGVTRYPPEITEFLYRRVRALLDQAGLQSRTLEHILAEAYVQGIRDAVDVMEGS